jgi:galactose mutarotase-like enzyme
VFSISEQADRYATYVLKDSSTAARLEVVPERGGLITRWQVAGQDILYFDAERFADPSKSVRGGIPILFPICGNLPENQYTWAGQTYTLKQHGFARDLPWTVADRAIEPSAVALTLTLTSTEQTRRQYPFDFQLQFTYRLRGRELALEQTFQNTGDRPMPFSTGLHPYFWCRIRPLCSLIYLPPPTSTI